jgi:hypothetical protein
MFILLFLAYKLFKLFVTHAMQVAFLWPTVTVTCIYFCLYLFADNFSDDYRGTVALQFLIYLYTCSRNLHTHCK